MRYLSIPLLAAAIVLSVAPAHADLGDQLAKLLPKDGAAGDRFGVSVAMSGKYAIVGARLDNDNHIRSGSAYIFNIANPAKPVQVVKLVPYDGAEDDWFGFAVDIGGPSGNEIAVVGSTHDDDIGSNSGAVYLLDLITGEHKAKLLPDDGAQDDWFGYSVAISGDIVIVGSPQNSVNGYKSGSAYLFDVTTGLQIATLSPDDIAELDFFGISVSINDTFAIVGSWGDDDNGNVSGSAYIFDISNPAKPVQTVKLLADDGAPLDTFGGSVVLSGQAGKQMAIVGARSDDDNGAQSGSAYLFNAVTGKQLAKILPDSGNQNDKFGHSVAIIGTTVCIGAYRDNAYSYNSGSAFLFDISDPQKPSQIAWLRSSDGSEEDLLGISVAIGNIQGNEVAIIGAHQDDDNGEESGSAYIFDAGVVNCPWDLDKSGSVDTSDLLELFAQWGTSGPADFDESGFVDTSDLLILFANWGPCV